jgi:cell division septation protein DedD
MENFEPKPTGVREKNLYVVHLDTPRIIILTSIVVGIVAASFLLGMTLMKDDKPDRGSLALNEFNLDDKNGIDIFNKGVPPIPDFSIEDNSGADTVAGAGLDKGLEGSKDASSALDVKQGADITDSASVKTDILTGDNIKEIIPPVKKETRPDRKTVKQAKAEPVKKQEVPKKTARKESSIAARPENNKSSHVKEVSRDIEPRRQTGGFAVQVASYDVLARAEKERNLLKSKRFDAYIDRTVVNGKNYFRVRIGPLSSKDRAFSLLQEIQSDNRYAGSYLVKD